MNGYYSRWGRMEGVMTALGVQPLFYIFFFAVAVLGYMCVFSLLKFFSVHPVLRVKVITID